MGSLRGQVRRLPLATEAYELAVHAKRKRGSRHAIRRLATAGAPIKLDLGAGPVPGQDGWTTVDSLPGCDLYWDLRDGIPFADGTVDAIYSSHLFEHLTFGDGQRLMEDCVRALRPGGSFSIVVPNARLYIEGYLGIRDVPDAYYVWEPAYHRTTAIDAVNYVAYMAGEHRYLFDLENLLHRMRMAGLEKVSERAFDPATDRIERDYESIYAVGSAP